MSNNQYKELAQIAIKGRKLGITMIHSSKSGHTGGAFSAMDFLSILYFKYLNIDPQNPKNPDRDRFVLSKGHCTAAMYPVLAMRGFFEESELMTFRKVDSNLSGHVEMNHVKGVDMSTGSLGQGLSVAVGMALNAKVDHKPYKVYALMGDGEIQEGQIWEAAMAASKFGLNNLIAAVDCNKLQLDGPVSDIMPMDNLADRWRSFGWKVIECNGHSFEQLDAALYEANKSESKPSVIILDTIKGKGVSFIENQVGWHGHVPSDEEYLSAMKELDEQYQKLEVE